MYEGIIKMFSDELELLVKETGSYKSLYTFNRIVHDNKQKWNNNFIRKSE